MTHPKPAPRVKTPRPLKRTTPVRRVSPKRRAEMAAYSERRDAAVGDGRQPCQIASPVCTRYVQHLHEPLSRGRAGGLAAALRGPEPIPCCDRCNDYCSENPVWAHERGFIVHAWEV